MPVICQAQELNSKILMTVAGRRIQAGEFIRMYKKSLEPEKPLNLDDYLQQFIVFKLKVADALNEGFDTTLTFKKELSGYRNQLAQSYLTDNKIKDKLLLKAYQRSLNEINAWHILVALPPESSPEDTLKAWEKVTDIRERIIQGESFEQVARGTSDDQSVKENGGNLGYFTAFQMIMPFEDAAYSLKKGTISMPVRTPWGYHIIKVSDKRPSKGRIKVAHIMKAAAPGINEKEAKIAEDEINSIYKKLQEGTSFSELAKTNSDDKASAAKGGELNWFGTGEIISTFSEAAFSIKDTGNYSRPVRTIYGWHIIKLIDRKAPGTFEESKSFLESKINQSNLNSLSKKSFVENLKKEYKFKINQNVFDWFIQNTDTLTIQGLKKYDRSNMPPENLYSFANQVTSSKDFANYIEKRGPMVVTRDSVIFINRSIEIRVSDQLINYENSQLEKKYPEFRYLMNEFHDGILLFEISGRKVWNRVNEDSIGLHQYYEDNKNKFLTKRGISAKIYSIRMSKGEKQLTAAFKKFSGKPDLDERLMEKFNRKNDTLLIIKEGNWYTGDNPDIDKLQWVKGSHSLNYMGFPAIIMINNVTDAQPMKLIDIREKIITGYQEYLENRWMEQLKEKYSVKIDNSILEEVKNKLKDE